MPKKFIPSDPNHFNCDGCGRTFHHSQREETDGGEFCVNCVEEKSGTKSASDEERVLTWKRQLLRKAAVEFRDAAAAVWAKRGNADDVGVVTIAGPFVSITIGAPPVEIPVSEEDEAEEDPSLSDA